MSSEEGFKEDSLELQEDQGALVFTVTPPKNIQEATGNYKPQEILKICPNGDIYVRGKLAENDKKVVDGLRDFVSKANES